MINKLLMFFLIEILMKSQVLNSFSISDSSIHQRGNSLRSSLQGLASTIATTRHIDTQEIVDLVHTATENFEANKIYERYCNEKNLIDYFKDTLDTTDTTVEIKEDLKKTVVPTVTEVLVQAAEGNSLTEHSDSEKLSKSMSIMQEIFTELNARELAKQAMTAGDILKKNAKNLSEKTIGNKGVGSAAVSGAVFSIGKIPILGSVLNSAFARASGQVLKRRHKKQRLSRASIFEGFSFLLSAEEKCFEGDFQVDKWNLFQEYFHEIEKLSNNDGEVKENGGSSPRGSIFSDPGDNQNGPVLLVHGGGNPNSVNIHT